MCGRFTMRTPSETIADLFSSLPRLESKPRYNIAPSQDILAVRADPEGHSAPAWLRWGLIPFWADDPKIGNRMINARSETIAEKPAFRAAFKKRRCLIPADGFYEWRTVGKAKQPVYIHMKEFRPFFFAGLWEKNSKSDDTIESCTIITTAANELLESIHHRMPVILNEDDFEMWLDPEFQDSDQLLSRMQPFQSDQMAFHNVSNRVNKPAFDDAKCLEPAPKQNFLFE